MKALTISQPFASMIADGVKWIENRTWPTVYRGPLAIHAGKGLQYLDRHELAQLPSGCVIAIAKLVACVHISDGEVMPPADRIGGCKMTWEQFTRNEHAEGPFCWILEDVRQIDHVPCRGAQGLWNWEPPS